MAARTDDDPAQHVVRAHHARRAPVDAHAPAVARLSPSSTSPRRSSVARSVTDAFVSPVTTAVPWTGGVCASASDARLVALDDDSAERVELGIQQRADGLPSSVVSTTCVATIARGRAFGFSNTVPSRPAYPTSGVRRPGAVMFVALATSSHQRAPSRLTRRRVRGLSTLTPKGCQLVWSGSAAFHRS